MFDTEINRLIERCVPDLIARAPALGSGDATPVLIVGMPRSGTTLVEQIISSHPEVSGGGELNFWNERGATWHQVGPAGIQAPFLRQAAADYRVSTFESEYSTKALITMVRAFFVPSLSAPPSGRRTD